MRKLTSGLYCIIDIILKKFFWIYVYSYKLYYTYKINKMHKKIKKKDYTLWYKLQNTNKMVIHVKKCCSLNTF